MTLLSDRLQRILDESAGLTQVGLASAAAVSKQIVNQWMDGKIKSMNIDAALNLEVALGYNHIWLMTGKGSVKVTKAVSTDNVVPIRPQLCYLTAREMEIITCYREATEAGAVSIEAAASAATKKAQLDDVRSN